MSRYVLRTGVISMMRYGCSILAYFHTTQQDTKPGVVENSVIIIFARLTSPLTRLARSLVILSGLFQ